MASTFPLSDLPPLPPDLLRNASHLADRFQSREEPSNVPLFPVTGLAALQQAHLLSAPLPREYGGEELGRAPGTSHTQLLLLKEIGRGNLVLGRVYEGHLNALQLVSAYGTAAQIEQCARDVCHDHRLFGVWNTEPEQGVRLHEIAPGCFRLEGKKSFCTGAGFVSRPLVTGDWPGHGWQMCLVPLERVSTRINPDAWQPLGMEASASYEVDFTGVELSPADLIGQPGDYYRPPWFLGGAIRFAAVQLGGAEALSHALRRFLQGARRTADPHQQSRAGEVAIAVESGLLWLRGAALQADRVLADPSPAHQRELVVYAHMMRTAIEEICQRVLLLVERSVGARGLLRPHPFAQLIRDLRMYLRQPAPDAALLAVGRYALEEGPRQ